jgi:hypothetical protein
MLSPHCQSLHKHSSSHPVKGVFFNLKNRGNAFQKCPGIDYLRATPSFDVGIVGKAVKKEKRY